MMVAASFDIGTENIAGQSGNPRTFVMGGNMVVRWHITGPWSVALRPSSIGIGTVGGPVQTVREVITSVSISPYKWITRWCE